ncbi:MAG: excinuclease ABC subunit UvrA [Deltaproteobacteria bacterium]|nr:excinuclease ABC subunit UvrA [Deltaproteobacteria bacterium]
MPGLLRVRGACEHNLRHVDVDIPHGKLVVMCGVSGSGKSSLAFDTIHAESQRRFVEAMSSWVRAQVGQAPRPQVEWMDGLLPSIGVAQRGPAAPGPRQTVATASETYDLLRVLYARAGEQHCPVCDAPVWSHPVDTIVRELMAVPEGTALTMLAPVARARADIRPLLEELGRQGFLRARVDGEAVMLDELPRFAAGPHDVDLVIDRFRAGPDKRDRMQESVATALRAGKGEVEVEGVGRWATRARCPHGHGELPELAPRLFSFNSPVGACPGCKGLGVVTEVDAEALVDSARSLADGAVRTWTDHNRATMLKWASAQGIDTTVPWSSLPWEARERVHDGDAQTEGALATARRKPDEAWTVERACPACAGARLGPAARAVRVAGRSLPGFLSLDICVSRQSLDAVARTPVTAPVLDELGRRLAFLDRVGLGYLSLDRAAASLSGGEWQRLRLAAQVGNGLAGVLYVLDEPTAGLHASDTARLVALLRELVDAGNTVLAVEHDPAVIAAADWVIEVGPGAGAEGGRLSFAGEREAFYAGETVTARWASGRESLPPAPGCTPRSWLRLSELSGHNLRGEARFPLGVICGVAGPSGAGKSSLVFDTLAPALSGRRGLPGRLEGQVRRLVRVDGGLSRSAARSTLATASRLWEPIRQVYARTPEAKLRGFGAERFSAGAPGGRCEACQGEGQRRVAMHFLPDVVVPCEVCDGKRFDEATLACTFKGFSVADVLAMPIRGLRNVFGAMPALAGLLETLDALGLGYVPLGQPVDTLSGGEAQRLRLAREIGKPGEVEGTLYLLDEPSVGLHPADLVHLVAALRRLVTLGGSVIVVEHDAILLGACDWVIHMGPGAGPEGGRVVSEGPCAS